MRTGGGGQDPVPGKGQGRSSWTEAAGSFPGRCLRGTLDQGGFDRPRRES